MNTIFSPDWYGVTKAMFKFMLTPDNYRNAILPEHIVRSYQFTLSRVVDRIKSGDLFSEGDFNRWTFNHILAVHPATRFLTAMLYKTEVNGRARLFYKDSTFLKSIKFDELNNDGKPYIFHNAFNFNKNDIDMFANETPTRKRKDKHKPITAESLCACSALPFIEETVAVGGEDYCEGALIDTLNFYDLLKNHNDLDEIWINRIVDVRQIRRPKNQHDALANLCQMFAATVGADDVKLFKLYAREGKTNWSGTIVDIPVDDRVNFEWERTNLDNGRKYGHSAADAAHKLYVAHKDRKVAGKVLVIPDDLDATQIADAGLDTDQLKLLQKSHPDRKVREDLANLIPK